jgi:sugar/nucleoside kinase (ribokinase family)
MAADKLDHVVTTNGAGDTYKAAFLARLVQGADPRQCLEFAREVVARHLSGRALRD